MSDNFAFVVLLFWSSVLLLLAGKFWILAMFFAITLSFGFWFLAGLFTVISLALIVLISDGVRVYAEREPRPFLTPSVGKPGGVVNWFGFGGRTRFKTNMLRSHD